MHNHVVPKKAVLEMVHESPVLILPEVDYISHNIFLSNLDASHLFGLFLPA